MKVPSRRGGVWVTLKRHPLVISTTVNTGAKPRHVVIPPSPFGKFGRGPGSSKPSILWIQTAIIYLAWAKELFVEPWFRLHATQAVPASNAVDSTVD